MIQDFNTRKMIGRGNKSQDFYVLEVDIIHMDSSTAHVSSAILLNKVSAQVWHHRLGHPSSQRLALLSPQLQCDFSSCIDHELCYICPLAKQKRLPFVSHNNLSKSPFDLIHVDIWGPYPVNTHSGHRFFLTIVDDCTRFTWVFSLKHKSDVNDIIPYFFNLVAAQFHATIKSLRSDNAKELMLTNFLNSKGVLHQFSCVDRPQQNSVVERKHQHLLNVARALYFQS